MNTGERRELLLSIINNSLEQMHPERVMRDHLNLDDVGNHLDVSGERVLLQPDQKVWIMGAGKASVTMAKAAGEILGGRLAEGMVIAPDKPEAEPDKIQVLKGSHPVPDKESLSSTYELLHFAGSIPAGDPVLCLISGGTSALLCMPEHGIEIEEAGRLHGLLLESGMDIHQMNTVRKVISKVKAGGLLTFLAHTQLFDLVISDVPGDKLSSIGSGPNAFEEKQYDEAFKLLKQFGLWNRIAHSIRVLIARGMHEPVKRPKPEISRHVSSIISSAGLLADKVAGNAMKNEADARVIQPAYNDSIDNVETLILNELKKSVENDNRGRHRCLIFYGESSVSVTGTGKGGRNQELALRIALKLEEQQPVSFASIGTDGIDGPTDAAGAIVDETTIPNARNNGLNPHDYLKNNDSYTFFKKAGGHVKTGPTGNNLMDLQVMFISGGEG
jgi:glycerate 2-kinase